MHGDVVSFLGLAGALDLVGCFDAELGGDGQRGEGEEDGCDTHFELCWVWRWLCFEGWEWKGGEGIGEETWAELEVRRCGSIRLGGTR